MELPRHDRDKSIHLFETLWEEASRQQWSSQVMNWKIVRHQTLDNK